MSDFEDVRESIASTFEAVSAMGDAQRRFAEEADREIKRLWDDRAELRDEINAVANRLEALTRAVTTSPAEVAAAIVNDANRSTLKIAGRPGEIVSCESCCGSGSVPSGGACPECAGFGKVVA